MSKVRRAGSVTERTVRYKAAGREWSGHTPGQQQQVKSNRGHPGERSGKARVRIGENSKVRYNPGQ
ncbi:unnamed protein product [Staurois parvus]|uniref:Uncharacterized protein n=1 Tax=Staurois parvus TaxID=386267 RepID=A0ABN9CGJ2_9NEOB|nr:unnamed protein product [Staurois parvus]